MVLFSKKKLFLIASFILCFFIFGNQAKASDILLDMSYDPNAGGNGAGFGGGNLIQYFKLEHGGIIESFQINGISMNYSAWTHPYIKCESWAGNIGLQSDYGLSGNIVYNMTATEILPGELCYWGITADSGRTFSITYDTTKILPGSAPQLCDGGSCINPYSPFIVSGIITYVEPIVSTTPTATASLETMSSAVVGSMTDTSAFVLGNIWPYFLILAILLYLIYLASRVLKLGRK